MSRKGEPTATILDVARRAGVSRTTVSRVLNEPERVSAETLSRVTAAAEALRYTPNSSARGLRGGRTGLIALLVGDVSQPFHGALAQSVAARAEEYGLGVVLHDLGHSTPRLEQVLGRLPQQRVDGVIIATADDISAPPIRAVVEECARSGMTIVTGVEQFEAANVLPVRVDHGQGVRLATNSLQSEGFIRTSLLVGDVASPITRQLVAAADRSRIIDAGYTFEAAAAATASLPDEVDSLIVATLPMALGVMSVLGSLERRLPVIVCEEVPLAHQVRPSLTTAAVAAEETGAEMVRLVMTALERPPSDAQPLTATLRRRESF